MPTNKPEKSLVEVLKDRRAAIDREVDFADKPGSQPPKAPKPKSEPIKKVGVGKPSFDMVAAVAKLTEQMKSTDDAEKRASLKARIKALKANQ